MGRGNDQRRGWSGHVLIHQLKERYDKIVQAYRGSAITADGQSAVVPADAVVTLGSGGGFRCPRLHVKADSIYPVSSYHTRGRALDLVPGLCSARLSNGERRTLKGPELHSVLYPALLRAAKTQGTAITEDGPQPVAPGPAG